MESWYGLQAISRLATGFGQTIATEMDTAGKIEQCRERMDDGGRKVAKPNHPQSIYFLRLFMSVCAVAGPIESAFCQCATAGCLLLLWHAFDTYLCYVTLLGNSKFLDSNYLITMCSKLALMTTC